MKGVSINRSVTKDHSWIIVGILATHLFVRRISFILQLPGPLLQKWFVCMKKNGALHHFATHPSSCLPLMAEIRRTSWGEGSLSTMIYKAFFFIHPKLVGGFNPFGKIFVNMGSSSPIFGMKIKHIWVATTQQKRWLGTVGISEPSINSPTVLDLTIVTSVSTKIWVCETLHPGRWRFRLWSRGGTSHGMQGYTMHYLIWGFPKMVGFPNNHGFFLTKHAHFGVFWGYHHLRKHPYKFMSLGISTP